ncbi:MAG: GAF domain-containing protein [Chitinophagales bacterium]
MNTYEPFHIDNLTAATKEEYEMWKKDFPFQTKLSLKPLIDYWRNIAANGKQTFAIVADEIIKGVEAAPELLLPIEDVASLQEHQSLINLLMCLVSPYAIKEDEIMAAIGPYQLERVYATPKFIEVLGENFEQFKSKAMLCDESLYYKTLNAYAAILHKYYEVDIELDKPMLMPIADAETGLLRFYKGHFNAKFTEIIAIKEPPKLTKEDIDTLLKNFNDLALWKKYIPTDVFELHGIMLFNLTEVTEQSVLSALQFDLLKKNALTNPQNITFLERELKSLFMLPDLRLGLTPYQKNFNKLMNFNAEAHSSFILQSNHVTSRMACPFQMGMGNVFQEFIKNKTPYFFNNLGKKANPKPFEESLLEQDIQSGVIVPLFFDNQFVGVIELMSKNPQDFSSTDSIFKVNAINPLFSIAFERALDEMDAQVQSFIKENYTSLHPAVEWRFTRAAMNMLERRSLGLGGDLENIVFDDVYPLFGATDVRDSSTKRNHAIQEDLIAQLNLAKNVLDSATAKSPLPFLDSLCYKINQHIGRIAKNLGSSDEVNMLSFLSREVESLFPYFEENIPHTKEAIEAYKNALDPELGVLYEKRKQFEHSMTKMNEKVAEFIDKREEEAQAMFPHYFEKYKTDGVEYNIYIGQSLSEKQNFDPLYLKNLRLWQLITTAQVAQLTAKLKPTLPVPLDATHLLLVHSAPLAIQFRIDEKQFDVDGAYNIRYEIIKKRIDKAYIRDTEERLTQPNKIAIVYSQDKEALEYREYLEYLFHQGYIEEDIEDVELEQLQGVQGLRALRVEVKLPFELTNRVHKNGKKLKKEIVEMAYLG